MCLSITRGWEVGAMRSDSDERVRSSSLSPSVCDSCRTTVIPPRRWRRRRRRVVQHSQHDCRKRPQPTAGALAFTLFLLNLLTRRAHWDTHANTNIFLTSSSSSSSAGGVDAFSPLLESIFPRTPKACRRMLRDRPRGRFGGTTTTERAAESTSSFGQWREATSPFGDGGGNGASRTGSGTPELSRASYALVCSAVEKKQQQQQQQQQALLPSEQACKADANWDIDSSFHVQLDVTSRVRAGRLGAVVVSTSSEERGRRIVGNTNAGGIGVAKDREGGKSAARRRSSGLDGDWPEVSGEEVPFEFAHLRESMEIPCSIQLVQRGDRKSLVYVNGTEVTCWTAESQRSLQDEKLSAREGVNTADRDGYGEGAGVKDGTLIRLVGEMAVPRPAYLQVRQGTEGKSDNLLVSHFGLARGGSVSRLDLDPSPRSTYPLAALPPLPSSLRARGGGEWDYSSGRNRPKPTLKSTWSGPLLWPNEVNQVPTAALLRLARGKNAELQYLAQQAEKKRRDNEAYEREQRRKAREALQQQNVARPRYDSKAETRIDNLTRLPLPVLPSPSPVAPRSIPATLPLSPPRMAATPTMAVATGSDIDTHINISGNARNMVQDGAAAGSEMEERGEDAVRRRGGGRTATISGSLLSGDDEHIKAADGLLTECEDGDDGADPGLLLPLPQEDGVLVADGFLMPGKADGGVYMVLPRDAERVNGEERIVRLTGYKRGWFHHRAVWLVLPGGKKVVLTARVHKPLFGPAEGELVLLEMPQVERPLAEQNLPWREIVLVKGPDVMFEVIDLDPSDATVEVICAEFFGGRLTMHSVCGGGGGLSSGARPSVTESWVLDDNAGPAYAVTAADLRGGSPGGRPTHLLVTTHECTYDYSFFPPATDKKKPPNHPSSSSFSSIPPEFTNSRDSNGGGGGNDDDDPTHCTDRPTNTNPRSTADRDPDSDADPDDRNSNTSENYASKSPELLSGDLNSGVRRRRRRSIEVPRGAAGGGEGGWAKAGIWAGAVTTGSGVGMRGGRRGDASSRVERGGGGASSGGGGGGGGGSGGGGGALLAYEIPQNWRVYPRVYPSPGWRRVTLASGFRVRGMSINPGAPGFPYIFYPHKSMEGKQPPHIALAGDCSQSAYILRPSTSANDGSGGAGAGAETGGFGSVATTDGFSGDPISYELACTIDVPGTVGSLAVSYGPLLEPKILATGSKSGSKSGSGNCGILGGAGITGGFLVDLRRSRPGAVVPAQPPHPSLADFDAYGGRSGAGDGSEERSSVGLGGEDINRGGDKKDGWAKLFVPNYDGNRIYVFSMEPAR